MDRCHFCSKKTSSLICSMHISNLGFIGFLAAIDSIKALFYNLVEKENAPMKYLLTYKFSQDHLELFFGAVRSAGG